MLRTQNAAFSPRRVVVEDAESQQRTTRRPTDRLERRISPRSSPGKLKDFLKKKQRSDWVKEAQRKALEGYYAKRATVSDMKRLTQRLHHKRPQPLEDGDTQSGAVRIRYKRKPGAGSTGPRLPRLASRLRGGSIASMSSAYKPEAARWQYSSIDLSNLPVSKLELRKARRGQAVYCSASMHAAVPPSLPSAVRQEQQHLENHVQLPFSSQTLLKEFTDRVNARANKYNNFKTVVARNNKKLRTEYEQSFKYSPRTKVLNGQSSQGGSIRSSSIERGVRATLATPRREILVQTNRTTSNTRNVTPLRRIDPPKRKMLNVQSGRSMAEESILLKKRLTADDVGPKVGGLPAFCNVRTAVNMFRGSG